MKKKNCVDEQEMYVFISHAQEQMHGSSNEAYKISTERVKHSSN